MAERKREPISREAATDVVGGAPTPPEHTHEPCTYSVEGMSCQCECWCNCACRWFPHHTTHSHQS